MIGTLFVNDIRLFFRNRFFAIVTALALVLYLGIYFLLPDQSEESLGMAFFIEDPQVLPHFGESLEEEENATIFATEAEMLTAIEETDDFFVGLSLPEDAARAISRGEPATLNAYYMAGVPAEARQAFHDTLLLVANAVNAELLSRLESIVTTEIVVGRDLLGAPLSLRDRFMPLLLVVIVLTEVLGLATLIIKEIESGTVRALITGPLRLHEFYIGKTATGLFLTFGQLLILTLVTGRIAVSPLQLLTTLLLGSLMIVGMAFLVAAISGSNMSVMAWGAVVLILFMLPAVSIILPGLATAWMEIVPSFYFANALHLILNFDAGWSDIGRHLSVMAAVGLVALIGGGAALRRRF